MKRWCWIGLLGLGCLPARADDLSGRLRLQVGQEYDTNARRVYDLAGAGVPDDFLARLLFLGQLGYQLGPHQLGLELQTGAKLFYQQVEEHQVATRVQATYHHLWRAGSRSGVRLSLHDVTQAQHSRDYLSFSGEAFVGIQPLDWLDLEVWTGGRVFHFKPDNLRSSTCPMDLQQGSLSFSNLGPSVGLRLRARLAAAWTGWLGHVFEVRFFEDQARPELSRDRQDQRHATSFRLRFQTDWWNRHQLIAQASYLLSFNDSNSTGSSAIWHRAQAVLSMHLPWELTVHLMGTLQFTTFPDGRYLDCDYYEPDADENENSFILRLTYRLWDELQLVGQVAIYRDDFQSSTVEQPSFARETVMFGVSWGWSF